MCSAAAAAVEGGEGGGGNAKVHHLHVIVHHRQGFIILMHSYLLMPFVNCWPSKAHFAQTIRVLRVESTKLKTNARGGSRTLLSAHYHASYYIYHYHAHNYQLLGVVCIQNLIFSSSCKRAWWSLCNFCFRVGQMLTICFDIEIYHIANIADIADIANIADIARQQGKI